MSVIAARAALTGGKSGWKNPYVTDGLIAMWDGEWNVGGGVHDAAATTWTDLVGNATVNWSGGLPQWDSNALITKAGFCGSISLPNELFQNFSCECLYQRGVGVSDNAFTACSLRYGWYGGSGRGAFYSPVFNRVCVCGNLNVNSILSGGGVHYTAGTFDGVSSAAYVDGQNIVDEQPPYSSAVGTNKELCLGALYGDIYSANGRIYCVRLYNRALTAAEIAANYAVDKERFNLP